MKKTDDYDEQLRYQLALTRRLSDGPGAREIAAALCEFVELVASGKSDEKSLVARAKELDGLAPPFNSASPDYGRFKLVFLSVVMDWEESRPEGAADRWPIIEKYLPKLYPFTWVLVDELRGLLALCGSADE
ncbi:MAG TPA: hypothetical protein VJ464_16810 [Blastocatellia bacterium]|nr:hypothetical protein [Blastocatellia bacterium]